MNSLTKRCAALGAGLAVAMLSACGGPSGGDDGSKAKSLTVVGYGGESEKRDIAVLQKPFTGETDITIRNDAPPDHAKLKAMVDSGNVSWDIIALSSAAAEKFCGKYLEPIDTTLVDMSQLGENQDLAGKCGVPGYFSTSLFLYNTKKFNDDPPTSIDDFFDTKKYPGKRIFPPTLEPGFLEYALMADGVDPKDLYPLDIDRALRKLDTIKEDSIYPDSYGAQQQGLASGGVAMGFVPPSRAYYVLQDGAPYAPIWDRVMAIWDVRSIPKGAPNAKLAHKYLDFTIRKENQKALAEAATLPPISPAVKPDYDKIQAKLDAFSEEHRDKVIYSDAEWWGKNIDLAYEKFGKWKVR